MKCVQVYEAVAGLEGDEESVKPYLLVWLHGMDNGSIEPGYLTTIQKRLRHRVIFVATRLQDDHCIQTKSVLQVEQRKTA